MRNIKVYIEKHIPESIINVVLLVATIMATIPTNETLYNIVAPMLAANIVATIINVNMFKDTRKQIITNYVEKIAYFSVILTSFTGKAIKGSIIDNGETRKVFLNTYSIEQAIDDVGRAISAFSDIDRINGYAEYFDKEEILTYFYINMHLQQLTLLRSLLYRLAAPSKLLEEVYNQLNYNDVIEAILVDKKNKYNQTIQFKRKINMDYVRYMENLALQEMITAKCNYLEIIMNIEFYYSRIGKCNSKVYNKLGIEKHHKEINKAIEEIGGI